MSECVVRMEMPQSCKKCISTNCIWGKNGSDYLDVIAALQDFRKVNNAGFPDFCPIICRLPEGHGRLVDMRDIEQMEVSALDKQDEYFVGWNDAIKICQTVPTIVPAERSEEK